MSAEVAESGFYEPWQPDRVRQQLANHTIADVLNLPPDSPRVELADGVMLVVPSPTEDHQDISSLLWHWLRRHAPKEFKAVPGLGVAVELNQTYEPDVLLRRAGGTGGHHFIQASEVVIAIDAVGGAGHGLLTAVHRR